MLTATVTNWNVLGIALATLAALAAGSGVRLLAVRRADRDVARQRLDSLKAWWGMAIVVMGAALLGKAASVVLFAMVSALALREFLGLVPGVIPHARLLAAVAYGLIPLNYLWIWLGWSSAFVAFLPLAALMLLSSAMVLVGQVGGFVSSVTRVYWGVLLTNYFPAFAVLLFTLPPAGNPAGGVAGWFLLLVLLTAMNDIAQALIGRRIGKHLIRPSVSPHKTWEGFFGGVVTATLMAIVLARWLTPFGHIQALLAGLLISITGFLGDLNISAVKRDAGVKDAGRLLPGQGGVLDRINSLTFSAPAFYYFVVVLQHRPIAS